MVAFTDTKRFTVAALIWAVALCVALTFGLAGAAHADELTSATYDSGDNSITTVDDVDNVEGDPLEGIPGASDDGDEYSIDALQAPNEKQAASSDATRAQGANALQEERADKSKGQQSSVASNSDSKVGADASAPTEASGLSGRASFSDKAMAVDGSVLDDKTWATVAEIVRNGSRDNVANHVVSGKGHSSTGAVILSDDAVEYMHSANALGAYGYIEGLGYGYVGLVEGGGYGWFAVEQGADYSGEMVPEQAADGFDSPTDAKASAPDETAVEEAAEPRSERATAQAPHPTSAETSLSDAPSQASDDASELGNRGKAENDLNRKTNEAATEHASVINCGEEPASWFAPSAQLVHETAYETAANEARVVAPPALEDVPAMAPSPFLRRAGPHSPLPSGTIEASMRRVDGSTPTYAHAILNDQVDRFAQISLLATSSASVYAGTLLYEKARCRSP